MAQVLLSNTANKADLYGGQLEINDILSKIEIEAVRELPSLSFLDNTNQILANLEAINWAFANGDTGYLSHDVHPYPAKFIPQIPRNLIAQLSLRGELVWDPFGGCGTTALESILLGRCALSTDINPLAKVIGEAKTLTLIKEEEEAICDLIEQLVLLSAKREGLTFELAHRREDFTPFIPEIPNLKEWFHENAITELAYLRWRIESLECIKAATLAKVSFSKSILKASYQDGETRYTRRPREVETGAVIKLFAENLSAALRKVRQLSPILRFRVADFRTVDLRLATVDENQDIKAEGFAKNSVDLIVTSPPYPNTTDYHLYHRFRLFWLGFDPRDLADKEIGSHLRHQKEETGFDDYLAEMRLCLIRMKEMLRPGRYAVLVLGDGIFKGVSYDSATQVGEIARQLGFDFIGAIERHLPTTKRSFISAARRLKTETLVVLRKPSFETSLTLMKPPYKLWSYEDNIRKREIEALLGAAATQASDDNLIIQTSVLSLDKVRKLTFTHGFQAPAISKESTWQAVLENGDTFNHKSRKKDPKYATHGIHEYKGKFYPQLAKSLFNLARLEPTQLVLDPFCGSGTVLLEAYLNGLRAVGTDINTLAIKIARAKTEILDIDPYLRDRVLSRFQDRLDSMSASAQWISTFSESSQTELLSWFPTPVLAKLGWLLHHIEQVSEPCVRELLEVLVSSIVRKVSQQDPRDLRIRRRQEPLKDAPVYELFKQRLCGLRRRLQHFSERVNRAPVIFHPAKAINGDCRLPRVFQDNGIAPASIDAVVTSPPYATALPYIDTDRLSLLLLFGLNSKGRSALEESLIGNREINKRKRDGIDAQIDNNDFFAIRSQTARSVVEEVRQRNMQSNDAGFRRQNMAALLYLYFRDMSVAMSNLNPLLRDGASAFFVIGDTKTTAGNKEISITSGRVLQEIGTSIGWELADVIPISVTTEDRRHSKNSITENEIIWFKKPAS